MLAAPRLQQTRLLATRPISVMASLVEEVQPAPLSSAGVRQEPIAPAASPSTIATTGTAETADALNALSSLPPPPYRETPSPSPSYREIPSPTPSPSPAAIVQPVTDAAPPEAPPVMPAHEATRPAEPAASPAPGPPGLALAPPIPPSTAAADVLFRHALQRYRAADERLGAKSAQAVYPAVNERALARAFDDLESQHLTFDSCEVQVHGESAAAACRGTTRYVTKVGSRDPRTESRVWNFTLRKDGTGWKIDTARAER